ncbi:hypothetical protein JCM16161A_15830 [Vulcanisaeta sp. JCM 16161]
MPNPFLAIASDTIYYIYNNWALSRSIIGRYYTYRQTLTALAPTYPPRATCYYPKANHHTW